MVCFINATLVLTDCLVDSGFVLVEGTRIKDFGSMDQWTMQNCRLIDCHGMYVSPGFIDIHTHGAGGHDFMDGTVEAFVGAGRMLLEHGVTSVLPTSLTSTDEALDQTLVSFRQVQQESGRLPRFLGLHLEGPYLALSQKGAQPERFLKLPEPSHYRSILERAEGAILRWTYAPELPGALDMADDLADQGIIMTIGHSDAEYEDVKQAIEHGFSGLTHFYSAMSSLKRVQGRRVLGVVECGYLFDELFLEIIADGVHLPPELLRLIVKCKAHRNICLVSDSMRAAGMGDGPSVLGGLDSGHTVYVEHGVAMMPDRQAFAGSVATADRLIRTMLQETDLPLYTIVAMMTANPARCMKLKLPIGKIERDYEADLIVFDSNITINKVMVGGKLMMG